MSKPEGIDFALALNASSKRRPVRLSRIDGFTPIVFRDECGFLHLLFDLSELDLLPRIPRDEPGPRFSGEAPDESQGVPPLNIAVVRNNFRIHRTRHHKGEPTQE